MGRRIKGMVPNGDGVIGLTRVLYLSKTEIIEFSGRTWNVRRELSPRFCNEPNITAIV